MALFRKKKTSPPELSRSQALSYKPVKNMDVKEERNNTENLLLVYPLQLKPLLADVAKRFGMWKENHAPLKKLELDEMGKFVWERIDGNKSVKTIATEFATKYNVLQREAEVATASFLKDLGKRGLIAFTENGIRNR